MRTQSTNPMAGNPTPARAAVYLRVSTRGQERDGMGLDAQRAKTDAYARTHGLEVVATVTEAASGGVRDGETLSHEHRPVLLDLLDRAAAGQLDMVLVARLDRLSRDHATLVFLERTFHRHGVEVVSATEENGDGAYAAFVRQIMAGVAELERQVILDRVRGGKDAKRKLGRHVHGRAPYGYRTDRGVLSVDDDQAPVVRRVFELAKDGESAGRIVRALDQADTPTPQGGKAWSRQAVLGILRNPVYAGERYGIKNAHPTIVSRRMFNTVQRALAERSRAVA